MSPASSSECLFLPDDQEEPTIYASIEYDETEVIQFDELLDSTQYDDKSHSPSIKREASDELELFAAVNACSNSDPGHAKDSPSPQPWRKGLWCLNQKSSTTGLTMGKTRKSNAAPPNIVSPAHLVVNDNYALRSPRSVTQPSRTKTASSVRGTDDDMLHSSQSRGYREVNLTPSPVHNRYMSGSRSDYIDTWQQDFQNFSLLTQPESLAFTLDLKPQQKCIAVSKPATVKPRAVTTYHAHGTNSHSKQPQRQPSHELSSILQANLHATSNNLSIDPEPAFQFIAEDGQNIADWISESQHSSSSSHRSCTSHQSHYTQRSTGNFYNTLPPQTFWSPPTTHIDTHTVYASREHYPQLIQPKPQRSPYQILKHGLPPLPQQYMTPPDEMIGMALTTDGIGMAVPYQPPAQPEYISGTPHGYVLAPPPQGYAYVNQLATYPALPPPPHAQYFPDSSPFQTPRRSRPERRTPSPQFSPTTRMPRSNKTRSPSRPDSTRKKSISRSGPMSDNDTRRHRSASRGPPRTPITPRSTTNNFGTIDFVNFTPKDARKLLSDVAPSGSSKTRARREQEAKEKRKKLGEAALHAVKVAGGDVETFQRQVGLAA